MKLYLDLLYKILTEGTIRQDRTGCGTRSIFGAQLRFPLQQGFPLVTTKKIHFKSVIYELLWFLKGETNVNYLQQNGVRIWNEWATENGDLGPVYGKQWRTWPTLKGTTIDQLQQVCEQIQHTPYSRRLVVSAWNVADLPDESLSPQQNVLNGKMALAPCHALFQFYVDNGKLSCQLYQRSCDIFLGLPFNIASYALLTHIIAHSCNLDVGEFIWTGGDVHLYLNHVTQARQQLTRQPLFLPTLSFRRNLTSIFAYEYDDILLENYQAHPAIYGQISV